MHSLWVFDRHCQAIYHQDWSHQYQPGAASATGSSFTSSLNATLQRVGAGAGAGIPEAGVKGEAPLGVPQRAAGESLPGVSRSVAPTGSAPAKQDPAAAAAAAAAANSADSRLLPFDEEAKLIYGVVYSLRNMMRKLGGQRETFHSFSTSTYTLSHLQTPTMYTFVMISDPPPGRSGDVKGPLANSVSASTIPGTAGMTLRGVMQKLWQGPWIQHAVRHPLVDCTEREEHTAVLPSAQDAPNAASQDAAGSRIPRTHGIDNDALRSAIEQGMSERRVLRS